MNEVPRTEEVYEEGTRLFLSEVNQSLNAEKLEKELEKVFKKYGTVEEVFVPTRSTKAYAFVRLKSPEEVERAMHVTIPNSLFKRIRPAKDIAPRNKKRDRLRQEALQAIREKKTLASKTNVICQVHRSHFERLISYLEQHSNSHDFAIVGSMPKSSSRTVSFVFVHAPSRPKFCAWIRSIWFVHSSVHRMFLVDGTAVEGGLDTRDVSARLFDSISTLSDASIRLQVFPPKLCPPLLEIMETRLDEWNKGNIALTPKISTHVLGLVQVLEAVPETHSGLFCIGLWESTSAPLPTTAQSSRNDLDNTICRAYWKLQEAFERYHYQLPKASFDLIALDCGAAPGGWTQFLSRNLKCKKIYSIDPGMLHASVLGLESVTHWPETIQKSLPKLQEENTMIDVWVSDMCVKDMKQQVDWLLKALEMEVVGRGTFFTLTLKCILGHSTQTFDRMVEEQVQRLQPLASDLQTVHLFSNRYSERTILGYFSK